MLLDVTEPPLTLGRLLRNNLCLIEIGWVYGVWVINGWLFIADPRQWSEMHVAHWLQWALREFSLEGSVTNLQQFHMRGKDICAMGKEAFIAKAPDFLGDILWEHLELLQKGIFHFPSLHYFKVIFTLLFFRCRERTKCLRKCASEFV